MSIEKRPRARENIETFLFVYISILSDSSTQNKNLRLY